MVSALDTKLLRDLRAMRGQVVTIALVVACGIASFATTAGCYESLVNARDDYYAAQRFPDVFARLKRAPISLLPHVAAIPSVSRLQDRVVEPISIPMPDLLEPATGQIISLPSGRPPVLSALVLRGGRMPEPFRDDEVLAVESFVKAHSIALGDHIPAVINGTLRKLRVVGVAMSPEVLFAVAPGEFVPDPKRFAVLWMDREALASAYDMGGAFNDVLLDLTSGAEERAVIAELNRLLGPYGGDGAYGRAQHTSNSMLTGELTQLASMARVMPTIFLGVAAFLINLVLGRIVQLQRPQIAALKAMGYANMAIGLHFLKLVLVIVLLGTGLGVAMGAYFGEAMVGLYRQYFHFPSLHFSLDAGMVLQSIAISFAAAFFGAMMSVRKVVKLPPAEAMQPEPPAVYVRGLSERMGLFRHFGQATRMVAREVERRPMRLFLSSFGIACSVALLVVGRFSFDAIDVYMETIFHRAQRQDMTVSFTSTVSTDALRELANLPGVRAVEGQRIVRARLTAGHHGRDIIIRGHTRDADLQPFVDAKGRILPPPEQGLVLTSKLSEILDVAPGDDVELTLLEGKRTKTNMRLAGTVDELFGLFGHMEAGALSRLSGGGPTINVAYLRVDPAYVTSIIEALKQRPAVLGITQQSEVIARFQTQTADQMNITTLIITLFAAVIAAGVIYNNARVALSTRNRDLASLRVLGFRRSEISAILLGELALQVLLALGPGMLLGTWMASSMLSNTDPEQYRFPLVISLRTYTFAALVTVASAAVAALLVRRKLDHLDLIGVLKTRG